MSDDNAALKTEYQEIESQRSAPLSSASDDFSSTYISVHISLFGKTFIAMMAVSFVLAISFLIFSYTSYGRVFLRELRLTF